MIFARKLVAVCLALSAGTQFGSAQDVVCYEQFAGAPVEVTRVVDSLTVEMSDGRMVRPAGFYIPTWPTWPTRLDGDDLAEAESYLRSALVGRTVQLFQLDTKTDRHSRVPAFVAFPDGRSVAADLLTSGKALLLPHKDLPCMDTLRIAERFGRRGKRGFWSEGVALKASDATLLRLIDHYVTVRGRVLSVGIRQNRHYLNFGVKWNEDFTVELAPRTTKRLFLRPEALQQLEGQWVTVRGRLRKKGGPMIVLEQEGQIDIPDNRQ
ncbi:MAG: hypothetical protein AAFY73_05055 [Pseudomonadota bacterium]